MRKERMKRGLTRGQFWGVVLLISAAVVAQDVFAQQPTDGEIREAAARAEYDVTISGITRRATILRSELESMAVKLKAAQDEVERMKKEAKSCVPEEKK